jgi:hypothetical protein
MAQKRSAPVPKQIQLSLLIVTQSQSDDSLVRILGGQFRCFPAGAGRDVAPRDDWAGEPGPWPCFRSPGVSKSPQCLLSRLGPAQDKLSSAQRLCLLILGKAFRSVGVLECSHHHSDTIVNAYARKPRKLKGAFVSVVGVEPGSQLSLVNCQSWCDAVAVRHATVSMTAYIVQKFTQTLSCYALYPKVKDCV